jgi:hypothetical protein
LASVFLLETFLDLAVAVFFVAAFLEETLGVAVFLTPGLETTFVVGFFDAVFLGFSVVSLEVALEFSVVCFLTAFVAVFLGVSLAEEGFLAVVVTFLM